MEWTTTRGTEVPPLGQGTWRFGEDAAQRSREVDALRAGIEAGLTLIDTAEAYAEGRSEEIVRDAVADCRDQVFLTTKVWPSHAGRAAVLSSLDQSLKRLGTDWVDLYLLHWPSSQTPLAETMAGLVDALDRGLARHIGVSNFPAALLEEAHRLTGGRVFANQVRYGLATREPETTLAAVAARLDTSLMAYSPIRHVLGPDTAVNDVLADVAHEHGVSPAAVALAWIMRPAAAQWVVMVKAANRAHLADNAAALRLALSATDLDRLDRAFPASGEDLHLQTF